MRLGGSILLVVEGLALSAVAWMASDGRFGLMLAPLILGLPWVWRRQT